MSLIRDLGTILGRRQRMLALLLLAATIGASLLEAASVALVLPMVDLLSNAGSSSQPMLVGSLSTYLGITDQREALVVVGVAVLAFYVLKSVLLTGLVFFQYRYIYRSQAAVSNRLLRAYLFAPWTFHLQRNSADLLRNILSEVPLVFGNVLYPIIVVVTESLVAGAVISLLLVVDPISTSASFLFLGGSSWVFYRFFRAKTDALGKRQQRTRGGLVRWVNQALGGVKETVVLGRQSFFVGAFSHQTNLNASATIYVATLTQVPRLILETLLVISVGAITALGMARGQELGSLLPQLALFGAAGYRLMPSAHRIISSITNIRYHLPAITVVRADLDALEGSADAVGIASAASPSRYAFAHAIELRDVSFRYPGSRDDALDRVSLTVPKGSSVAIVGQSGAGKTTLVDVILGLLKPHCGHVLVDGVDTSQDIGAWQRLIGYIPQAIYLSDDTIRRNVAFGVEDAAIDDDAVWRALRYANLDEFVNGLPDGLDTSTGERGVCMSGGQRQRIGIARALYHDPEVLVLDEATSALDTETEREITMAIEQLSRKKTLIVVAHRLSTIERCDIRYEIKSGRLVNCTHAPGGVASRMELPVKG